MRDISKVHYAVTALDLAIAVNRRLGRPATRFRESKEALLKTTLNDLRLQYHRDFELPRPHEDEAKRFQDECSRKRRLEYWSGNPNDALFMEVYRAS